MSHRSDDEAHGTGRVGRPSRGGRPRDGGPDGDRGGSFLDDFFSSVMAVVGVGILLFAVAGVWPPMVAIESGSMDPHIQKGDLVFVMEEERFPGPGEHAGTGVVPTRRGAATDYQKFQQPGDVIVFEPGGNGDATPIIHRARFWVNESENWYDKTDSAHLPGNVDDCEDLNSCPAPRGGFITKGDNNDKYDQVGHRVSEPVAPDWVVGTAEVRVKGLGELRLRAGASPLRGVDAAALSAN